MGRKRDKRGSGKDMSRNIERGRISREMEGGNHSSHSKKERGRRGRRVQRGNADVISVQDLCSSISEQAGEGD